MSPEYRALALQNWLTLIACSGTYHGIVQQHKTT
jgi:hypothetical protein